LLGTVINVSSMRSRRQSSSPPEFLCGSQFAPVAHEQNERHFEHGHPPDARGWFASEQPDRRVDFLLLQPVNDLRMITLTQAHLEFRKLSVQLLQYRRQIIPQHNFRGGDPEMPGHPAAQLLRHRCEVVEKRPDEIIKLQALRRQREGAPVKQRQAEVFLQLRYLPADGRLLDAIGNIAHGLHDAAESCHVIEQLKVVNVHKANELMAVPVLSISPSPARTDGDSVSGSGCRPTPDFRPAEARLV